MPEILIVKEKQLMSLNLRIYDFDLHISSTRGRTQS